MQAPATAALLPERPAQETQLCTRQRRTQSLPVMDGGLLQGERSYVAGHWVPKQHSLQAEEELNAASLTSGWKLTVKFLGGTTKQRTLFTLAK